MNREDIISVSRLNIDNEAYHADPCERPSLSSSIAKVLLDRSPAHAHHRHPRLGGGERVESKTFDAGRLAHKLLLGKGADIVVVEAKDWRTKAAQEERDAAYAEGHIPVLVADHLEAVTATAAILARLARLGIELRGESEVPFVWQEAVSGHTPIWCRGMLDHLLVGKRSATIYDLKTSRSAHPRACAAHVIEYGYDVQHAAYTRVVDAAHPAIEGRVDFVHIFAETSPPFAVTVGRLDGVLRERGARRWRTACHMWAECLAFDRWPDYGEGFVTIEAPPWALSQMQEHDQP